MHVAGVVMLHGRRPVTMPELKHLASTRLRRLPRFGQRAVSTLGGMDRLWVPVGRIDYDRHLYHHQLPRPAGESEAFELCARIHEQPLDRDRPLWEIHLVDGLSGGRQLLITKTHHAVADGLAAVEIAEVLFDPAPGKPRPQLPSTRFVETRAMSAARLLKGLTGLAFTAAGGLITPGGPFNGPVGPRRAFSAATLRADDISHLKHQSGGSFDDALVATVAAGIATYLRDVSYPVIPRTLRTMLPVSTRASHGGAHFGNHVSAVFIDLPIDSLDLHSLVQRIAASKATLRTTHAAEGAAMLVEAVGVLAVPMHTALLRIMSGLPFANLVLSDVPGPKEALYVLGRRVGACYPMMPLAPRVALSIASVTMGGVVGVGLTVDPDLVPEPHRLARAIEGVLHPEARAA